MTYLFLISTRYASTRKNLDLLSVRIFDPFRTDEYSSLLCDINTNKNILMKLVCHRNYFSENNFFSAVRVNLVMYVCLSYMFPLCHTSIRSPKRNSFACELCLNTFGNWIFLLSVYLKPELSVCYVDGQNLIENHDSVKDTWLTCGFLTRYT